MASSGAITVTALSSATILAVTIAGAVAAGGGEGVGLAFAGAGAGSGNTVHNTVAAVISGNSLVTTTDGDVTLSATDNSSITADGGGLSLGIALGEGAGVGLTFGAAVAVNTIGNTVTASIENSTVTSSAGVSVLASSGATIFALTVGIAGTLAGGEGGGIALSGAGSGSGNSINDVIEASIKNGSVVTSSGLIKVSATDNSKITAGAGSLTLAVGVGEGGGFAASVGVAAASNDIGNTVTAAIEDSTVHSGGAVELFATNSSTIKVVTVAGGVSAAGGEGGGIAFAGAGAGSGNTISNTTQAFISQGSTVTSGRGQDVEVMATDSSSITADGGGGTLAAAGGEGGGIAIAIGAAVAINTITNTTKAYIDDSTVTSGGKVTLSATSTSQIYVVAVGVALSLSGGIAVGVSASGSGAWATNSINNTIETYIAYCSTVSAANTGADAVSLTALDNSLIHSRAYAVSAAVGIAIGSAALAVGVVLAHNEIGNVVESYIGSFANASPSSEMTVVTSAGGVEVFATSTSNIDSEGVAVAASVALVGLSGSGASAKNDTNGTIAAFVQNGSTVHSIDAVQIKATDGATINSTIGTGAFSVGLVAVSMGVSLNDSTIGDTVSALHPGSDRDHHRR